MSDPVVEEDWRDLLADDPAARPIAERGGGWQHVPEWDGGAAAPHRVELPEMRIEGHVDATPPAGNDDEDLDEGNWLTDTLSASAPLVAPELVDHPVDQLVDSASRLGRRAARTGRAVAADPTTALLGLLETGTGHLGDEASDLAHAHPEIGLVLPPLLGMAMGPTGEEMRTISREAQERSPDAYDAGADVGMFAPMLIPGGEAPSLARAVAEPAVIAAADTFGRSDAPYEERLPDAALAGIEGAGVGAAFHGAGAAARAGRRAAPAARESADLAGLATLGGGRGTISRTDPRLAEFARLPGGIPGQAARARRLGLIGGVRSPSGVAQRSSEVLDRVLNEGAMAGTRRQIAESGAEMPVSFITDALEREAREAESRAARRPFAGAARELGDRFRQAYGSTEAATVLPEAGGTYRVAPETVTDLGATLPYSRAIEELSDLSGEVPWGSDRLSASASMGRRGAVREGMDNWIETQPGLDLPTYREGRLDAQTAIVGARQAAERAAQMAGNNGVSLRDVGAMAGAQSITGAALRFLASRGWTQFGQTARAEGREMIARALASIPEGDRWSGVLRQAIARGTLPVVHEMLMRTDPEYAQTIEATEAAGEQASTDGAAGLLSAPDEAPVLDVAPEGAVYDDEEAPILDAPPEGVVYDDEETER